jgi:hypothetical protein
MLDHQRQLTEYLIEELAERNIVFNEYLLETIVEIALYYFEYSDDTDEVQLSNYIFDSLVNMGYAPKQWVLDTVSGMIVDYMIDNGAIEDKGEIHFTFEDDDQE